MKHIQIRNSDMAWHIAANIQFPPNFDESKQYPAIRSCIQCVDAPSNVVLTFNESANDPVMHFC